MAQGQSVICQISLEIRIDIETGLRESLADDLANWNLSLSAIAGR